MSARRDVHISLEGRTGKVLVGGADISGAVESLTINADARVGGVLVLRLPTLDTVVNGDVAVGIPQRTHDALVALGWTPPADEP